MRIAFEASVLMRRQKTGVDWYSLNLCKQLVQQLPDETFLLPYISFFTKPPVDLGVEKAISRKVSWLPGRIYHYLLKTPVALPFDFLSGIRADVFIFPNFVRWPLLFCPRSMAVIHDLAYEYSPQHLTARHRTYLKWAVPRTLAKIDYAIAVSESTKRDIIRRYNFPEERIIVSYPGIDPEFYQKRSEIEIYSVREKYHLPEKFILSVCTLEPRKNLIGLLNAYDQLPQDIKKEYGLVLAGGKGWLSEELDFTVNKIRQTSSVTITGYIDQPDMPALYSASSVFAFVPFYEGFGMPALEAMACGAPVITSDNSSLPEVVGDAGLTVTAGDNTALTSTLAEVLSNSSLRQTMSSNGLKQSSLFRWEEQAKPIINILKQWSRENKLLRHDS